MITDRLLAAGGTKVVGYLVVTCAVLILFLGLSVYVNVAQVRGRAEAVGKVEAKLAAAEAKANAEIAGCASINERQSSAVTLLEGELLQCRGQQQDTAGQLALALRQKQRKHAEILALEQQRRTIIEGVLKANESDCNRPMCRALSDELLRISPGSHQ